jgi:hypothetical protein
MKIEFNPPMAVEMGVHPPLTGFPLQCHITPEAESTAQASLELISETEESI